MGDGFGGGDAEANAGVSAGALGDADSGDVGESAVCFFAEDFDFVDEGFALCVCGVESVLEEGVVCENGDGVGLGCGV